MYIKDKKLRNRDRIVYIFNFVSEEDVQSYFDWLDFFIEKIENNLLLDVMKEIRNDIFKRLDDKYANEEVYKSSMLFQDEMAEYAEVLMLASQETLINVIKNL